MFRTLETSEPRTASEQSAFDAWLSQSSAREEGRRDRLHAAEGIVPLPVWIVLFLSASLVFFYLLFFADSGESAVVQGMMAGSVTAVVVATLLVLAALNRPYQGDIGGLEPVAMQRSLSILDGAYQDGALQTFGSFRLVGDEGNSRVGEVGQCASDTSDPWNLDRCMAWMHPKTFRKHLFERLPLAFFFERNTTAWLRNSEDNILHPKMVELSKGHARHISECLYVHDVSGSAHDFAEERTKADYVLNRLAVVPHGSYITSLRKLLDGTPGAESPHFKVIKPAAPGA